MAIAQRSLGHLDLLRGQDGRRHAAFAGGETVISHTRLWGSGINFVMNLVRNDRFTVDLIAGFRYADLRDDVTLIGVSSNLVPVVNPGGPGGGVAFLSSGLDNHFYDGSVISNDYFERGISFTAAKSESRPN